MQTSDKGIAALIAHEAVVLSAYRDSAGIWSIGVGHTAAAGPPKPKPGMKITMDEALAIFRRDLKRYEAAVSGAVTVPVSQHEFDALVSFHFNTGAIGRASLVKSLNAGDRKKAALEFMNWTRAGGDKNALVGRRRAEKALFERGDYGDIGAALVYDRLPGKPRRVALSDLLAPDRPAGPQPKVTRHGAPAPDRSRRLRMRRPAVTGKRLVPVLLAAAAAALAFIIGKITGAI